jgi:hypothetical protein
VLPLLVGGAGFLGLVLFVLVGFFGAPGNKLVNSASNLPGDLDGSLENGQLAKVREVHLNFTPARGL